MQTKKNLPHEAASDAYARQYLIASESLERVTRAIADLPNPEETQVTWGMAGDLSEIASRLRTIVEIIKR